MSLKQHMKFWAFFVALFVLSLVLLSNILLPFILGMAVAYFLDPVADKLEDLGLNRSLATTIIIGLFVLFVVLLTILLVPVLIEQLMGFLNRLPGYIAKLHAFLMPIVERFVDVNDLQQNDEIKKSLALYAAEAVKGLGTLSKNVIGGGLVLVNIITLLVITPVVAFYLLRDWDHIVEKVDSWLPVKMHMR